MSTPMMKTYMELHIPIATINPTLEQIQNTFSQVLNNIVDIHKEIPVWGQNPAANTQATIRFGKY